jgi:hypothetical protein
MTFSWFRIIADKLEIRVVASFIFGIDLENPHPRPLSLRERGIKPEWDSAPVPLKYE